MLGNVADGCWHQHIGLIKRTVISYWFFWGVVGALFVQTLITSFYYPEFLHFTRIGLFGIVTVYLHPGQISVSLRLGFCPDVHCKLWDPVHIGVCVQ